MINTIKFLVLALLFLMCNCRHELSRPDLIKQSDSLNIIFHRNGNIETIKVAPNSEKHKRIIDWYSKNQKGWEYTPPVSYAFNVAITGEYFTLGFLKSRVIINYKDSIGELKYYQKEVNENELDYMNSRKSLSSRKRKKRHYAFCRTKSSVLYSLESDATLTLPRTGVWLKA